MLLKLFLLPLFLQVLLTVIIGLRSLNARITSGRSGEVRLQDITNNTNAWPDHVKKISNNFNNQFETPTLWYGAAALSVALNKVDIVLVVLAWCAIILRASHSFIHTGSNNIISRMQVFLLGFTAIILMWVWLFIRLFILD
jgi:hypothetical protein